MDCDHLRAFDVIGLVQELLHQLRAALAHGHCAERAVSGMRVGAEDHAPALRQHLTRVLVDDSEVRRHIDAAVLLRGREAEHVVILVDRAADCAERIVAVREDVGHGELRKARCPRRLNDADVGDVVRSELVKTDGQLVLLPACVVRGEDLPGHCPIPAVFLCLCKTVCLQLRCRAAVIGDELIIAEVVRSSLFDLYHVLPSNSVNLCNCTAPFEDS